MASLYQLFGSLLPLIAVGSGIVLVLLLRGRLGRILLEGLEKMKEVCAELARKGLHPENFFQHNPNATEQEIHEGFGSEVFMLITRLLALALALDVLLACYVLDASRVPLVVFDGDAGSGVIRIPFSIPTIMGLLSFAMATLQGAFLFEVLGMLPPSAEFLPPWWRRNRASRIFFRIMIPLSNLLLLLYVALLGLVAALKLQHIPWVSASVAVQELQIILTHLTAVFSLWIVVLGISAVFGLACLILQVLASIASVLLKAWVKPEKVRAQPSHVAVPAGIATEEDFIPGGSWGKPIGAPMGAPMGVSDETSAVPVKAKIAPYQSAFLAAGASGRRLLPTMVDVLTTLPGGQDSLRMAGYVPVGEGRTPDNSLNKLIRAIGAKDVSTTPREHTIALQHHENVVPVLLDRLRVRVQEATPKLATREPIFLVLDWDLVEDAADPLRHLVASLQRDVVALVVEVPAGKLRKPEVLRALETAAKLREEGVVATTILTDRQSPLTQKIVRERQIRLLARSLSGLIVSQRHHDDNPTGAQALKQLGESWPFLTLSVGSIALAAGDKLSVMDPGRWSGGSARGRGNVEQTRRSMEVLGTRLFSDESSRLFPAPFDATRTPLVGEVFLPFPRDHRFTALCESLEQWAAGEVPGVNMIFIAGAGEPDGSIDNHYFGQISWLYGFTLEELLQEMPEAPILEAEMPSRSSTKSTARKAPAARVRQPVAGDEEESGIARRAGKRSRRTPLRAG